ncbi:hypothetical protein [Streptococcus equinus]|uniref:hypothetical protein n=1 Tax=Streptococcus equinus TaxID=1335 RepID=UPI0015F49F68|nr:hypothetical protein [Streptococcus equinus]QMS96448.1 hypothetical protein H1R75_00745 [Streptococcus equinus]
MEVTNRGYINFNNEYNKHDQNPNQGDFGQPQGQQTSFFQGQTTQTNPDFSRNFGNANPMDINEDDLPF